MCKDKLGRTVFIKGGNSEFKKPEFVRDDYEQGVMMKNKDATSTSLLVTHGRK